MKIYKVNRVGSVETGSAHDGYHYTTNKKDAQETVKEQDIEALKACGLVHPFYTVHNIKMNKKSIISFLNSQCSHPDNG